jgi:hypothetical protein
MPRPSGAPHLGGASASHASLGSDARDFAAWWRALSASERRSVLAGFSRRPRAARPTPGACASCAECFASAAAAARQPPPTEEALQAMAASPEALAAWRAAHAAPPDDLRARAEELCGGGGGWVKPCKLGEGGRSCGLWAPSALQPDALAAFAHASTDASLLEWRVTDFTAALDAYLSDRLLCKVRARGEAHRASAKRRQTLRLAAERGRSRALAAARGARTRRAARSSVQRRCIKAGRRAAAPQGGRIATAS